MRGIFYHHRHSYLVDFIHNNRKPLLTKSPRPTQYPYRTCYFPLKNKVMPVMLMGAHERHNADQFFYI